MTTSDDPPIASRMPRYSNVVAVGRRSRDQTKSARKTTAIPPWWVSCSDLVDSGVAVRSVLSHEDVSRRPVPGLRKDGDINPTVVD